MFTVGILTISDGVSSGHREDTSGRAIEEIISRTESRVVQRAVVPDEQDQIALQLRAWSEEGLDLVLTTGGTGLGPRDVTPEATDAVIERKVPGIVDYMRLESAKENAHAILSRGLSGICRTTLIINLPGSPRGVSEQLKMIMPILPHAIDILRGTQADHAPPGKDIATSHPDPHHRH